MPNGFIERSTAVKITKTKNETFLDEIQKIEAKKVGPTNYETQVNILSKKRLSLYRMNRKSFVGEIEK